MLEAQYGTPGPVAALQALQRDRLLAHAPAPEEDVYQRPMEEVRSGGGGVLVLGGPVHFGWMHLRRRQNYKLNDPIRFCLNSAGLPVGSHRAWQAKY